VCHCIAGTLAGVESWGVAENEVAMNGFSPADGCAEQHSRNPGGIRNPGGMMTNSRVLFFFTLLAVVWFGALTQIVRGQDRPSTSAAGKTGQADIPSLKKQAESGDAKAEYLLGKSYMMGAGVSQDYQEAARWLRFGCDPGLGGCAIWIGFSVRTWQRGGAGLQAGGDPIHRGSETGPCHGGEQSRLPV